jgi:dipeptidyl aminopeptidase/acylaminoacyl peptidase
MRRPTAPALLLLLAAGLATAAPRPAAAQDFTIEEILSAPFPASLAAAREADVVAWVSNRAGSRNVWVAEGPGWEGRRLTAWEGDDGQELSGLTVTPDGRHLLVTRGGAPNRNGWVPTPAQDPRGAQRITWRVALADGAMDTVPGGVLSPDGGTLAYVEGGAIRVAPLAGGEERELANPRTGAEQLTWSPDGRRLAFVSPRGDHSFIGVIDVGTGAYRYLDASVDRDRDPAWSTDGRRLAWIRRAAEEATLPFFPQPEAATPWSIRVADVATGEARELFRADPGAGSRFSGVVAERQLWWTADGFLVFPWEKEGWRRLWAVPEEGGDPRLLTPGRHEIQHVAPAPDGTTLLYDSNLDDIDRRHVWSVTPSGGPPVLLTPGEGVEWAPVATGAGTVAFLGSGAREPARPWILGEDGDRTPPGGALPASFPDADELVVPEAVVLPATDGLPVHGQLFLPPGLEEGERAPAVIFLHGGSRRQMLLGFHLRGYYHNAYALNQWLAARGYVVLSLNYRSGTGYGLDFREAEAYGASGASEVRDVLGAGLWLAAHPRVDPERIGLWGGSYGGFLTAQGLVHAPDLFAAGVDIHGVHDWNEGIQNFVPSYEPAHRPELAERAFQASPLAHVDRWEDPVLLIHGDDDRNVRFSETVTLVRELRERGVPHEVLVFPDEVHGFLLHRSWVAAYEATAAWFDRWLGRDR